MSLVQVSSSQERLQDKGQFKSVFNKGYSFSNYFNGLMDIPPDSEIALHSASFRIKQVNSYDLTGSGDDGYYNMRMLYAPNRDSYLDTKNDEDQDPSHNPLLFYVPRRDYTTIQDVWKEITKALNLCGNPALQRALTTTTSIITNKTQINWSFDMNAGNSTIEPILTTPFVEPEGQTITLDADGTITKTSATNKIPTIIYTNSNGIHSVGEVVFSNLTSPAVSGANIFPKTPKDHLFALGVKRPNQQSWDDLRAYKPAVPRSTSSIGVSTQRTHLTFNRGLSVDYVPEYAFVIRNRDQNKQGDTPSAPVIDIVKAQITDGICDYLTIATGDAETAVKYDNKIPYSMMLDPQSDYWEDATEMDLTKNVIIGETGSTTSPDFKITFQGNKVEFYIASTKVQIAQTTTEDETLYNDLTCELSDIVYPLQPYLQIKGSGDSVKVEITPIKTGGQEELLVVPVESREDFSLYVSNNKIIPNGVFNKNGMNSPNNYFDYELVAGVITFLNRTYDTITGDYLDGSMTFGLGENASTDMKLTPPNGGVLNPNVDTKLGSTTAIHIFTPNVSFSTYTSSYLPNTLETTPFLKGIYVRLRNLPNRSTFGSINQADTDKLIAVINKYDYTETQAGEEFPIYNYNENEKLYVSLNNPSLIQTNKLDFQLVDSFGVEVKDVEESMLVLHIRPCPYGQYFKSSYN